jgi:Ser/Thr protein kinase RdoA (MazF antagonist)
MDDPTGADAAADACGLGAALATLHSLAPPEAPALTRLAPDRLAAARQLVVRVRPDVEGLVDALAGELLSRRTAEDEAPVCLHGDVHPKNAIVTGREIALIDVEDLAIGPAAADVGSFLAGLFYLRRGGRLSPGKHRDVTRAFLSGYTSVRPLPPRPTLRWYAAAALLVERILRSVNRVRPLGLVHLPDLLRDARALLTDGTDDALEP